MVRRVSDASVSKVVKLHRELQDSVCARRLVVALVAVALGLSVAVAVVTSEYHTTARHEAATLVVHSTAAMAIQGVRSVFGTKFGAVQVLAFAMDSGWLEHPLDGQTFARLGASFVVQQPALQAVHAVHR